MKKNIKKSILGFVIWACCLSGHIHATCALGKSASRDYLSRVVGGHIHAHIREGNRQLHAGIPLEDIKISQNDEGMTPVAVGFVSQTLRQSTPGCVAAGGPAFHLVRGVDARRLPFSPLARDGIQQVAGAPHFMDSPLHENVSPESQGSRAVLGQLAALRMRHAALGSPEVQGHVQPVFSHLPYRAFTGQYLMPWQLTKLEKEDFVTHLESNIAHLNIVPQWGASSEPGTVGPVLQVFNFAPSFQGSLDSLDILDEKICELIGGAQYKALAELAALRCLQTGERVPLHLTLLGQGTCRNPASVLQTALTQVRAVLEPAYPVDVYVHAYSVLDLGRLMRCEQGMILRSVISATDLMNGVQLDRAP